MNTVVACVLLVWAGVLLGVSFITTPAKFMAETLTLAVAMDVGRVTFALFNKIEWIFFAALSACTVYSFSSISSRFCLLALFAILCVQTFFLLPELSLRASIIIAGQAVPSTYLHSLYVVLEIVKVLLLGIWGVYILRTQTAN